MDFKNGVNADKDAYGKGIKFVNVMDIFRKNCLSSDDVIGSVEITEKQLNEYSVVRGDILFNRTSETPEEIAFSSVYLGEEKITFGGFVIRGRQTKQLLLPEFAKYCFKTDTIRKEMIRRSQGAVRANIGQKDLAKVPIVIPPETDQKMIVSILDEWGHMIEKTEALIDAKERQFGWLKSNLIKKKCRSDAWSRLKLGAVAHVKTGQPAPQGEEVFTKTGIPFVRVSSLDRIISGTKNDEIERIQENLGKTLKLKPFEKGTLVFAKSGMSALLPRVCKLPEKSYLVSHLCAITPQEKLDVDFLLYYLSIFHPKRLIQGDGFPSIKTSEVASSPIHLPPIDEQKSIAHTLNTAKEEITLLKKLADQYRTQKRGLMQKLLSGEWPIKNKEAA